MIVLICGGRNFHNKNLLFKILDMLPITYTKIVNGAAKGADKLSTEYAEERNIPYQEYPANWDRYRGLKPNPAGFIRNGEMLEKEKIDLVIAFPGGGGTKDMTTKSKAAGIEVISVRKVNGKPKCFSSFTKDRSVFSAWIKTLESAIHLDEKPDQVE